MPPRRPKTGQQDTEFTFDPIEDARNMTKEMGREIKRMAGGWTEANEATKKFTQNLEKSLSSAENLYDAGK